MEIVDNLVILAVPGAMEAGLGDPLFWGALALGLGVAWVAAFPVNRWLIARGRGHAVAHAAPLNEKGGPGGPPSRSNVLPRDARAARGSSSHGS